MNRKKNLSFALLLMATCLYAASPEKPVVTAHRGGHIDALIPENSIAGIASAKRFGYGLLECDPKKTADGVIVLMHDNTINRTMRLKEGYLPIEKDVKVSSISYQELLDNYVLASDNPAFREPVPTLEEFAIECKRQGMKIMLHSQTEEADILVHNIMGDEWICFSSDIDICRMMRREGFGGLVLYSTDEMDVEKVIGDLLTIGGPVGISTMDTGKPTLRQLTPEYIKTLKENGFAVQSSIFKTPYEVESVHDGCNYVLSDFYWATPDGCKHSEQWQGPCKLAEGETAGKSFSHLPDYGAVYVELEFKGHLQINVNGHIYEFNHADFDSETIGIRLYGCAPMVEMKALGTVRFRKAKALEYKL